MTRALLVSAVALISWLVLGAHDASWAVQEQPKEQADQRGVSDNLRLLSPGSEITVFLKGGRLRIEGVLREVHDDAIVVDHKRGGGSTRVPIADIERIQTRERGGRHPVTYVLIGVATAIGALVVLALASC